MTFLFLGLKVIFKNLGGVGDFFWCNFEFDGTDGNQKCPLIFFIFCGYIDKVYIYLYTKKKLSPTFLWVSKFDVKLGVLVKNFKIRAGR